MTMTTDNMTMTTNKMTMTSCETTTVNFQAPEAGDGWPGPRPARKPAPKSGMILPFAMCVLALISLLGAFMMVNAASEITLSRSAAAQQETLNFADSAALISTLMCRILLHPELGSALDVLTEGEQGGYPVKVEMNEVRFDLLTLYTEANSANFFERYQTAGWLDAETAENPHLRFRIDGEDVSASVVNLDTRDPIAAGDSLGVGNSYDKGSESARYVTIVVSTRGRTSAPLSGSPLRPATIVTSMYREGM
jgi:hypothetical protein